MQEKRKMGAPTKFKPEYVRQAEKLCEMGHTDYEIANFFDVSLKCFDNWKTKHRDFVRALKIGKEHNDDRVKRSLYTRAVGYNYEAVKIFMPAGREKPVVVPYIEHVPPDVTAGIFWLKNRDPQNWRDAQLLEHVLGKYIISDQPMTEEQWAKERAVVLDAKPELPPPVGPERTR